MSSLSDLLTWLPEDPRDDAVIAGAIRDELVTVLRSLDAPWQEHYSALLEILSLGLLIDSDPSGKRRLFESHAWRIAHALGLEITKSTPWPLVPDEHGRLTSRETALLWCRFTRENDPWQDLDMRPVRRVVEGSVDPMLRALWRVATRSRVDQLPPRHRDAFERVMIGKLGLARLAVEEAVGIAETTGRIECLETIDGLLHDPVLQHAETRPTLRLLGTVTLAQAEAFQRAGDAELSAGLLEQWASQAKYAEPTAESKARAAKVCALHALDAGDMAAAGEHISRGLLTLAEGESTVDSGTLRAELLALHGEQKMLSDDIVSAAPLIDHALNPSPQRPRPVPRLHVGIVHSLSTARWAHAVDDLYLTDFYGCDSLSDDAGRAIAEHVPEFVRTRHELARIAPDVFTLGSVLIGLMHRWHLGRAWSFDDPYQALDLMGLAARELFGRSAVDGCLDLATDMLVPLRRSGWAPAEILTAPPLRHLIEMVPAVQGVLEAVIAGKRHPFFVRQAAPEPAEALHSIDLDEERVH